MKKVYEKYQKASELLFQAVELITQSIEILGADNPLAMADGYYARKEVRGFALDCLTAATLGKNSDMMRRIIEFHEDR